MASIDLYEHDRSRQVHADPGGCITCCGYLCDRKGWTKLGSGSVFSVTCKRCIAALRAAGDLPR